MSDDPHVLQSIYLAHYDAMTSEGLHYKGDIACELAWRDAEIERLRELVVWHTSSPMLETMEALGASEDELAVAVANWFATRPCHYDETLQAALTKKEDKP